MRFLNFLIFVFLLIFTTFVFAQNGELPPAGFEWLPAILAYLQTIPAVGKVLVVVFEICAIAAVALTALVIFLEAILAIPQLAAAWAGSEKWLARIKWFKEKVLPFIKYFSMFNAKKK